MKWNELNAMQQLAIEQAFYKKIAADVDTKNRDSLRGRVDAQIKGFYAASGAKSYDVQLNGQKVGTYSVTVSKEVPEKVTREFEVTDQKKMQDWFPEENSELLDEWLSIRWGEFAEWYFGKTGELPDGCEVVEKVFPGRPPAVKGTTLRVDPKKVETALGSELPTAIAGLLGGGADE